MAGCTTSDIASQIATELKETDYPASNSFVRAFDAKKAQISVFLYEGFRDLGARTLAEIAAERSAKLGVTIKAVSGTEDLLDYAALGEAGSTVAEDLNAFFTHVGKPSLQADKSYVNFLRLIKGLEG